MVRAVQDFSDKIAARGPGAVAMIYYAGHGVQLAGENYLLPVDAKIASPSDLDGNSLRLVDVMGTLESIPSRMRIVVLDACRNNPFPEINDAGRGLAIVDAPRGSIVGYSTAPGMEAQDGDGKHSPYTSAFLNVCARTEFADRTIVQAHPARSEQPDRWPADAMGKLVADLRLLFLRRYGGGRQPRAGSQPDRPDRVQPAVALGASGL